MNATSPELSTHPNPEFTNSTPRRTPKHRPHPQIPPLGTPQQGRNTHDPLSQFGRNQHWPQSLHPKSYFSGTPRITRPAHPPAPQGNRNSPHRTTCGTPGQKQGRNPDRARFAPHSCPFRPCSSLKSSRFGPVFTRSFRPPALLLNRLLELHELPEVERRIIKVRSRVAESLLRQRPVDDEEPAMTARTLQLASNLD